MKEPRQILGSYCKALSLEFLRYIPHDMERTKVCQRRFDQRRYCTARHGGFRADDLRNNVCRLRRRNVQWADGRRSQTERRVGKACDEEVVWQSSRLMAVDEAVGMPGVGDVPWRSMGMGDGWERELWRRSRGWIDWTGRRGGR